MVNESEISQTVTAMNVNRYSTYDNGLSRCLLKDSLI